MKILIVARGIPTKQYPMYGIFEMDQAKALSASGHKVIYFAVDLRSLRRRRKMGIQRKKRNGVIFYTISIPLGAIPLKLKMYVGQLALTWLYHKVFRKKDKPDIIHAHFTDMGYLASKLAEKENIPLVITEHSSVIGRDIVPAPILSIARQSYRAANRVIAVSSTLSKKIKDHSGVESIVVHNIIDTSVFSQVTREKHEGFRYVSVSNLVPLKRIDLLIDAFSMVHDSFPDTHLEIIGDGQEMKNLMNQTEILGIRQHVTFTGRLSRKEISDRYSRDDCFVLPSKLETFGVSYVEAMAAGLPVIATCCGGPEDFVTDSVGILRDMNHAGELAAVMRDIYENHSQYDPETIRNYVLQRFSPIVISAELSKVYDSILEEVING